MTTGGSGASTLSEPLAGVAMRKRGTAFGGIVLGAVLCAGGGGCGNAEKAPSMDEYLTRVTELGSYDEEVRRKAVRAILASPQKPTQAALRAVLRGTVPGNWSQRSLVTAAALLATWEDEETGAVDGTGLPELVEALRGPDGALRRLAVEALPFLGKQAVPLVADVLRSGQRENRISAAEVLGRMLIRNQEEEAGAALARFSFQDEESVEVRMAVVINLAEWQKRRAVEGFLAALSDPNEQVRAFAWEQIKKRENPPITFRPQAELAQRADSLLQLRKWWKERRSAGP